MNDGPRVRSDQAAPWGADEAYRLLFEHVGDMVCTLDLDGAFTSLNSAGETLTGYPAAELIGRSAIELIAPELRDEAVHQFRARLDGGARHAPDESVLVSRGGRRVPIEVTSAVFRQDGRPLGVLGLVRDLSAHQSAQEVLRQSDERFRSAFASAAIGMALVAPDGRFLQVNDSLCELVGYPADELITLTFQEITHPDDLEADLGYVRQMLSGEIRTYQMEKRYSHKQGHIVRVLLSVSLVRDSRGSPLHFISQIQDITEQRHAQEAMARSEAQLAEAQQIAHIGSWEWDIAADTIIWSAELYRIFGVDPEVGRLTYERYLQAVHPEDRPLVEEMVAGAARTGAPFSFEHRVALPGGVCRWVLGRGEVTMGPDGPLRMCGIAQEITERKEAEEQLRQAELRYRTMIEALPLTTYICPLDMTIPNHYCSPQVERLLGYSAEEWETDPGMLVRIVHPDDRERVLRDAARVRQTGEPIRDEYRYIARDGRLVWVLDETYLVHDERGEPFVQGFLLDISERKQAEEERNRLRDELFQAQKLEAIGRLAGGVAHDFNNMLTAIRGYSELLIAQLGADSKLRADAEQIRRAAEQASELPRQLLAFSRNQPLQPGLVDLNEVVSAAADLLGRLVPETIKLVITPTATSPFVLADPSQIEQVLLNLVLNARDAMPSGGTVTISTRNAELATSTPTRPATPGRYVVVSVADTGEGIDDETKARLFEPFFTTKEPGKGSGLGLASVYGIVGQSGGLVEVESQPARGSRFDVYLPCDDVATELPGLTRGKPAPPDVDPGQGPIAGTVLLAEDEDVVRRLAVTVLEHAGFRVIAAADGAEALDLWDETPGIDVLVSDMVMPGISGGELAERLVASSPGLAVVLISGYTPDDSIGGLGGAAAPRFLQKPFSPDALVSAVRDGLHQSSRQSSTATGSRRSD